MKLETFKHSICFFYCSILLMPTAIVAEEGEAKIKGGLFAKAKVKQSQGGSLAELVVDKILSPARNYEAVDIKIGEVSLVEDFKIERAATSAKVNFDNKTLVRVPVTVQIKQDFLENTYKILDEASVDRYKGGQIKAIDIHEKGYVDENADTFFLLLFADMVLDGSGSTISIFGGSHQPVHGLFSRANLTSAGYVNSMQARLYALPKLHFNALVQRMQGAKLETGTMGYLKEAPSVNLRILNSMGEAVFEDYLTSDGKKNSLKRYLQSSSSLIVGEGFLNSLNNPAVDSVTALFASSFEASPKNFIALIDLQQRFEIIAALSDDVLEAADSIQVEISY